MNYVEKNNQILNEWRSKYHKQGISCDFFAEDGIMFRGEFDHNGANWLRKESEDGIHEHDRVDAMLILYTTFMTEADMSDTQRAAINKEHFETWMRCMESLQNMYGKINSGSVF